MKNKITLFLLGFSSFVTAQSPMVETANGKIQGTTNADKTVQIFKSIPFAAPPVGELRWKAPQPAPNWSGIRQCTEFPPSPIQNKPAPFMCWSEEFIAQPEPLSEDCLYLNIWASEKAKQAKQPVLVWIYGGGLSSGSSNCAIYDGEEMAQKGVVFVSINYRVGVLGFMAHPELTQESEHHTSGNYGFLDQMEALRWIQKNIAAFGGDPNNVTIAGQSAGAFSVNALVASRWAKGLFHKAIAQSGGLLSRMLMKNLNASEQQGVLFMQKVQVSNLAALRQKSATELQERSNAPGLDRFGTTLDGYVLPTNLIDHFSKGFHNDVPLLTGWVTEDGALFGNAPITVEAFEKEAKTKYGDKTAAFLKIFPVKTDAAAQKTKKQLGLFQFAALPSHLWAGFNKSTTYLYQFSRVPPDKPNFPNYGAFHTAEVPYALHTLKKWNRAWQPTDWDLEAKMSSYWVNFAKTGHPNGKDLPKWSPYTKNKGIILELGDKIFLQPALFKKEFDFLERTYR